MKAEKEKEIQFGIRQPLMKISKKVGDNEDGIFTREREFLVARSCAEPFRGL